MAISLEDIISRLEGSSGASSKLAEAPAVIDRLRAKSGDAVRQLVDPKYRMAVLDGKTKVLGDVAKKLGIAETNATKAIANSRIVDDIAKIAHTNVGSATKKGATKLLGAPAKKAAGGAAKLFGGAAIKDANAAVKAASEAGLFARIPKMLSKMPKMKTLAVAGLAGLAGYKYLTDGDNNNDNEGVPNRFVEQKEAPKQSIDKMILDYIKPVARPKAALPTGSATSAPSGRVTKPRDSEIDRMISLMINDSRRQQLEAEAIKEGVKQHARTAVEILSR